jgi:hypothetical protein
VQSLAGELTVLAAGFGARLTGIKRVIRTGSPDVGTVFLARGIAGLSLVRLSVHVFFGFVALVIWHGCFPFCGRLLQDSPDSSSETGTGY